MCVCVYMRALDTSLREAKQKDKSLPGVLALLYTFIIIYSFRCALTSPSRVSLVCSFGRSVLRSGWNLYSRAK